MTAALSIKVLGTWRQGHQDTLALITEARLGHGTYVVGSQLRPGQPGLQLDYPGVSRRHAEILSEPGRTVVRDLGSDNGIWRLPEQARIRETSIDGPTKLLFGPVIVELAPLTD